MRHCLASLVCLAALATSGPVLAQAAEAKTVLLNGFDNALQWTITHKQGMVWASSAGAKASLADSMLGQQEGRACCEFAYEFRTEQRDGVQLSLRETQYIPDKEGTQPPPDRIGLWVYGDLSGHTLRYRFTDANGRVWEMEFPGAETIDWVGWRYLEGPLAGIEGVAWPVRFGSLDILDATPAFRGRGLVKLDGLSYCWLPEAERAKPLAQAADVASPESRARMAAANQAALQTRLADLKVRLIPDAVRAAPEIQPLRAEAEGEAAKLAGLKPEAATPELLRAQGQLGCELLALATRVEDTLTDLVVQRARAREQKCVLFTRPLMAEILPDTVPGLDELASEVTLAATPGEFRAASVAVFTTADIEGLHLSTTDLRGPGRALPASTLRLRSIRVWYQQSLLAQRGDRVDPVLTPELLEDANGLFVPAYTTKQYWLVAHVPDDAPAGQYEGRLILKSHNLPGEEVPLKLTVYPFRLRRHPQKFRGMFYAYAGVTSRSPAAKEHPPSRLADFRDLAEHGVDTIIDTKPFDYFAAEGKGEEARLDFAGLARVLGGFREAGLHGPVFLFPFRGAASLYHEARFGQPGTLAEAEYRDSYRRVVKMIEQKAAEEKWPVLYDYTFDEPPDLERCLPTLETLREAGAHVAASDFRFEFGQQMIPYCNLFIYSGGLLFENNPQRDGNMKSFLTLLPKYPDMTWGAYIQTWYDGPYGWEWCRLTFGVPFLKSPLQSVWGHLYSVALPGDPEFDFGGAKRALTVYPGPAGNVSTLQWEMVREGTNDAGYVYTLQSLIEEARQKRPAAAAEAEWTLQDVLAQYNEFDVRETMERLSPADYERLRGRVAEAILALAEAK